MDPSPIVEDEELVELLRDERPQAGTLLFDRYSRSVERMLYAIMGPDPEAEDLLHEVFLRALQGVHRLEDRSRLRSWLMSIAVFTAREWIRRRSRRRWLRFFAEYPEETCAAVASEEVSEALRAAYEVMAHLPEDERIVFSLRFIEEMDLTEISAASGLSLSTVKRRLSHAETLFVARARGHEALREWLLEGRWRER